MTLGAPWLLWGLPVVAATGWLLARARRWRWITACRLQGVAPGAGPAGLSRRDGLALGALTCVVLALARPQWNPRPYDVERRGRDLVLVLDVSRSMLAADVFPSRLEAAKIAIHEALPALAGQRLALITFAGSASARVPLTLDHEFVRYMLARADPTDVDVGSTSLQAAIEKALDTVLTNAAGSRRDMVIFTDGEDHLSNLKQTGQLLAQSDARVLIIGLGDPARGAPVPAAGSTNGWMQYHDTAVRSRLEENTLTALAHDSPRVTYFAARTRPFDLPTLYGQMIAGARDDVPVGKLRQVRYTEGYPVLLLLGVALWLAGTTRRSRSAAPVALGLVFLWQGCAPRPDDGAAAAFRARCQRGGELRRLATEQAAADAVAARLLLLDAREEFLRAALLQPGDLVAARQITGLTGEIRALADQIEKQRAAENQRREDLAKVIERLRELAARETRLAEQSQRLLRRQPAPPPAELAALAAPAATEQQAVNDGTAAVLETVKFHRDQLRELLRRAYGTATRPLLTELDGPTDLLAGAVAAQQQALANLAPDAVRWPPANTAVHIAGGRLQQALDELRGQQPPKPDRDNNQPPPLGDEAYDEDRESTEADAESGKSLPVAAGELNTALSLRSLPVPNYTAEEILAEEAANEQQRAKHKAARAGSKVEKNW